MFIDRTHVPTKCSLTWKVLISDLLLSEKLFLHGAAKVAGFPVVTSHEEKRVVGYITKKELKAKLGLPSDR